MPLIYTQKIDKDGSLLVWKMTEDDTFFEKKLLKGHNWNEFETISHPQKQKEWLAGRFMLQEIARHTGLTFQGIYKDPHGKPYLTGSTVHVSISHTADYIAVASHPFSPIGIDMEKPSEKLIRVTSKFLTPPEAAHAGTVLSRLVRYWCAKESLYKLNGRKKVSFNQILIQPFQEDDERIRGSLEDQSMMIYADILLLQIEDYCLSVALEKSRIRTQS